MDARASARPASWPRCAALMAAVLAAGCDLYNGDDPPPGPVDGSVPGEPDRYAVRGTAIGLGGPVTLVLGAGGGSESVVLAGDGAFAFERRLATGDFYSVSLADPSLPCALQGQTGAIAGADAEVALACTGASLASLAVSGAAAPIQLVPGTTAYGARVPLAQESATVTATVATPGDTLAIAGAAVDSGVPSAPLALGLGENPIDIVVENSHGWRRTYRLTVRRAAEIVQVAYIKAADGSSQRLFGLSVALSGDTLAVGGHYEDLAYAAGADYGTRGDNEDELGRGEAYVFQRSAGAWQQEARLVSSDLEHDHFGYSVALAGDTLAVGAERADVGELEHAGTVHVFLRSGGAWQRDRLVTSSQPVPYSYFGREVALAGDILEVAGSGGSVAVTSDTLVTGRFDEDSELTDSGAAYVSRREGGVWISEARVTASNPGDRDRFGYSVAVSGDTVVVGAYGEDSAATGIDGAQDDDSAQDSGAVYVFRRSGTVWQQEAYLKASNTDAGDRFGQTVAIAGDVIAVGAPGEDSAAIDTDGDQDDDSAGDSGAVYVFRRSGAVWRQDAYVKASNAGAGDELGVSVALTGDTLAVGAHLEDSAAKGIDGEQADERQPQSGAVYVFDLR
jgi:hypothetical protein